MPTRALRAVIEEAAAKENLDADFVERLFAFLSSKGIDVSSGDDASSVAQAAREACEVQAAICASERRALSALASLEGSIREIVAAWDSLASRARQAHESTVRLKQRLDEIEEARAAFQAVRWSSTTRH